MIFVRWDIGGLGQGASARRVGRASGCRRAKACPCCLVLVDSRFQDEDCSGLRSTLFALALVRTASLSSGLRRIPGVAKGQRGHDLVGGWLS